MLRAVDAALALPRLGGMARPNGVVIVSERYWAFAGIDGSLREGRMPQPPEACTACRSRAGSCGSARRCRRCFRRRRRRQAARALPDPGRAPRADRASRSSRRPGRRRRHRASRSRSSFTILRGRALHLHGAEHRAIAAAEERRLAADVGGAVRPSRFSPRCGTNFAALALPVTFLADRVLPLAPAFWSPLVVLVALARADDGALADRAEVVAPVLAGVPGARAGAPAPDHA